MINIKKEMVLKTLIFIGLVAIVVSSYIRWGATYFTELGLEKVDAIRITNLDVLNTEIKKLIASNPKISLGNPNTVYISLPSTSSDCVDLDLPSLPSGWTYHCVTALTLASADGTGWLPATLSNLSMLPIDPTNNADKLDYYAFVANRSATGTQYVITAAMDSKKYLARQSRNNDPIRYEVGNDLDLWTNVFGLIGYWPFTDEHGNLASDKTGISGSINLLTKNLFITSPSCFQKSCIKSDAGQISLSVPINLKLSEGKQASYGFRFSISKIPTSNVVIFNPGTQRLDTNLENETGSLFVWFYDNMKTHNQVYKSSAKEFIDNRWHQIFITKDSDSITVYMDGQEVEDFGTDNSTQQDLPHAILNLVPSMSVNDLRIYNRPLSAQEVLKSFSSFE